MKKTIILSLLLFSGLAFSADSSEKAPSSNDQVGEEVNSAQPTHSFNFKEEMRKEVKDLVYTSLKMGAEIGARTAGAGGTLVGVSGVFLTTLTGAPPYEIVYTGMAGLGIGFVGGLALGGIGTTVLSGIILGTGKTIKLGVKTCYEAFRNQTVTTHQNQLNSL